MVISKPIDLLSMPVASFVAELKQRHIDGFYCAYDRSGERWTASHSWLQPLADYFTEEATDFDGHEAMFAQIGPDSGVLQGAFIHRTCRGAAAGGVRNWTYDTVEAWFRDGLRLAKGMTHKNALAGIWWGGGKGVMARNTGHGLERDASPEARRQVYAEYGAFMSTLQGCYITAEDVGTNLQDMAAVFSRTRYTTCIPLELGGSGNPSVPTARGVVRGLEAAFDHYGKQLVGATIAIQGAGHVGLPLAQFLLAKQVGRLVISDVDAHRLRYAEEQLAAHADRVSLHHVTREDNSILFEDCDAVCPCATGGILSADTIPQIRTRIVCGAANNQLACLQTDADLLREYGICYVPDFLVNRMGIVHCADEGAGRAVPDPNLERHLGNEWDNAIYNLTRQVLDQADSAQQTPQSIALELAEMRSQEVHPIWGHRSLAIIHSLTHDQQWIKQYYTKQI